MSQKNGSWGVPPCQCIYNLSIMPPQLFCIAAGGILYFLSARVRALRAKAAPPPPRSIEVTGVFIYPVKSMRGHSVTKAHLDGCGFVNDRRWLVVDDAFPHSPLPKPFMTQRNAPALATVVPFVLTKAGMAGALALGPQAPTAALLEACAAAQAGEGFPIPTQPCEAAALLLVLEEAPSDAKEREDPQSPTAQAAPWVVVPLARPAPSGGPKLCKVQVWRSTVEACADQGDAAAAWLSAALKQPVRLVYQDPAHAAAARAVQSSYLGAPMHLNPSAWEAWGANRGGFLALASSALAHRVLAPLWRFATGGQTPTTSFADGFPLLLASENSLKDLQARIVSRQQQQQQQQQQLPTMKNFRPNLVVSYDPTAPPWLEDTWAALSTPGAAFAGVKRCSRCAVTTTDQATGARAPSSATGEPTEDPFEREPLATLATYRASMVGGAREGGVYFGMNLMIVEGGGGTAQAGWVSVGDQVQVSSVDAFIGPL